jgi:hypothetical protein
LAHHRLAAVTGLAKLLPFVPAAREHLWRALDDPDSYVRAEALSAVLRETGQSPDVARTLMARVMAETTDWRQAQMLETIAEHLPSEKSNVLDILVSRINEWLEAGIGFRNELDVVLRLFPDSDRVLKIAVRCARSARWEGTRSRALKFLGSSHHEHPGVREILSDVPMNDTPGQRLVDSRDDPRRAAIEGLALGWRDDPDTPKTIRRMLASSQQEWLLRRGSGIVQELEGWAADRKARRPSPAPT